MTLGIRSEIYTYIYERARQAPAGIFVNMFVAVGAEVAARLELAVDAKNRSISFDLSDPGRV